MKKRTRKKFDDPQKTAENGLGDFGDYMQAKYTKLEEQFLQIQCDLNQKSNIFQNVSICVNGHTNPSADELKRIMLEHGGMFHHYQTNATKFIIASNLPDVKIRSYNSKNIIRPEWITECLKGGRQVDFTPYLLVTNIKRKQPKINFGESSMTLTKSEPTETSADLSLDIDQLNDKIAENFIKTSPSKPSTSLKSTSVKSAIDPGFLSEFFSNSRLHHIATLGADFKYLISNMRKSHNGEFPARAKLKEKFMQVDITHDHSDVIMHIDMDCFFVSVSIRNHPELRGLPVAVTHSKGRKESASMSEIASCSYEARAKGCKNGMFMGQALKLCPELKTIPYDFDQYRETAMTLYNSVASYTIDIEAVSCDELYADLSEMLDECGIDVEDFVAHLRDEIFAATGCTCSVGIGNNRLQARMATKKAKPNGQFSLIDEDVEDYMRNIPSKELPGVGPNTEFQLKSLNLLTCGDIQTCPVQTLCTVFGKKLGESLVMMAKGIDTKKLVFEHVRKSVSVEVNYGIRFTNDDQVEQFMKQVAEELSKRMKEIDKSGKLLTLKLMTRAENAAVETKKFMGHGVVDRMSKSISLSSATNEADVIHVNVMKLMKSLRLAPDELRGIGVQMQKFDEVKSDDNRLMRMFENHKKLDVSHDVPSTSKAVKTEVKFPRETKVKTEKVKKKPAGTSSIEKLFKKSKTSSNDSKKKRKVQTVEHLDPDVLAQLPPEIIAEILEEYKMPESQEMSESEDNLSVQSISIAETDASEHLDDSNNMFYENNWRIKILSKIDSNSVDEITKDLIQLIFLQDIEIVHNVLRYLKRKSKESNANFMIEIFNEIEQTVQSAMISKYSKKLQF